MFQTVPLSIIRSFSLYTQQYIQVYWQLSSCDSSQAVSKPVWHIPLLCVQWKTPDDGQRNCLKYVEFYSKNKFEKLVHLVGFIVRMYFLCQLHINIQSPQRIVKILLRSGMPPPSAWITADVISNCNTRVRAAVAVRHKTKVEVTFLASTPLPPAGRRTQQPIITGTDYKCIQYWHLCVTLDVSHEFQHHNSHYNTLQVM